MNTIRNVRVKTCFFEQIRTFCVKRKYPINPAEADKLPVFDYSLSNENRFRVYAWGHQNTGALGLALKAEKGKILTRTNFPRRLTFAEYNEVVGVATGFGFTAYVVKDKNRHKLYAAGLNTDSQIGYHLAKHKVHLDYIFIPQQVNFPVKNEDNFKIIKVSGGRAHMLVLAEEGLYTFGNNAYGQCGRQIIENEKYNGSQHVHFIPEVDGKKIINIEAGQDHTLAITENGHVYSTGWGADGQTGLGHYNISSELTQVKGDIAKENIIKIASTSDFVLALNDKGDVFGWGNTEYGQIPNYKDQQCNNPSFINLDKIGKIRDIAAGGTFCAVVNEKGNVYVWGFGLLGLGPKVSQTSSPTLLPPTLFGQNDFNPNSYVSSIDAGLFHMGAITNNGELYVWGRNKCGCLGLGHENQQYFPMKVALGADVKEIHCSADHTVALCVPYA